MAEKELNIPKRRFKEFEGAGPWEKRKLGDVLETHSFKPYLANPYDNGKYEVIQQGDNSVVGYADGNPFINYENIVIFGDHTVSLYKPDRPFFVATDGLKILSADGLRGRYLYSLLQRYKPAPQGYKRHYTILIDKVAWITENGKEQQKIGNFFRTLDDLITHQQGKLEKTKALKKAYLSEMFPAAGECKPKRRFEGFTDDWEQSKAADIAEYSKGNGYSKSNLVEVGTPIILYGRLYTKYQFAIDEVDTFATPQIGSVYSQGNEVIVPASGETAEDIARASAVEKSGVLLGGDLNILRPFNFVNPLFLALAISSENPQKELAKKAQGKSVVHIHNSDIQGITISYPLKEEQDRIVAVFRTLDNLITLHQRKLEKLQNLKKAYLNEMFV